MDLRKDPMALQRLRKLRRKQKSNCPLRHRQRSTCPTADYGLWTQTLVTTLTRSKFEQLSDELVRRSMSP